LGYSSASYNANLWQIRQNRNMKTILTIFAVAIAAALFAQLDRRSAGTSEAGGVAVAVPAAELAASTANLPPGQSPAAGDIQERGQAGDDDLLRLASERIDRYTSIAALVRYRIRLFESDLIGSGVYQQAGQGSERRLRLEAKTQVGEDIASRLQVCDGDTLWTFRELPSGAQLERLDLRRVRDAQRQAGKLPPQAPVNELATGGLPKLLEGLQMNFQTRAAEAGYLGDVPMWAVELEWKPSVLAALAPEQQEQIAAGQPCDFAALPQLPERVMVFLGHDDLFPRRIEFRRRTAAVGDGAGEGGAGDFSPIMTVELSDVQFNQPIDPRQFQYGGVTAIDVTDTFLQSRGLPLVPEVVGLR
jgi:hypothetical protein